MRKTVAVRLIEERLEFLSTKMGATQLVGKTGYTASQMCQAYRMALPDIRGILQNKKEKLQMGNMVATTKEPSPRPPYF